MIGKSEQRAIRAALKDGREIEINLSVREWRVTISTAPASPVWKQPWIARVYAKKPYADSSQWCKSVEEVMDSIRRL